MIIIVSFILLVIAASCNAIMDVLQFHYEKSIFPQNGKAHYSFWNPTVSWTNKYIDNDYNKGERKYFGFIPQPDCLTDGWHLFKTLMIFCICGSILTFEIPFSDWKLYLLLYALYGTVWNFFFNIFYNHILVRK